MLLRLGYPLTCRACEGLLGSGLLDFGGEDVDLAAGKIYSGVLENLRIEEEGVRREATTFQHSAECWNVVGR